MSAPIVIAEYGAGQQIVRWCVYRRVNDITGARANSDEPVFAVEQLVGPDQWQTVTAFVVAQTPETGRRMRDMFCEAYGTPPWSGLG